MKRMREAVSVAAILLALPVMAVAQTANVAGDWTLTVNDPGTGCAFVGPLTLTQSGTNFSGSATLSLVSGTSPPCVSGLAGTVTGTLVGSAIQFGVATGSSTATFNGTVGPGDATMSGNWDLDQLTGTWHAERVVGVRAPALSAVSLAGLSALLLTAGLRIVRRRAA